MELNVYWPDALSDSYTELIVDILSLRPEREISRIKCTASRLWDENSTSRPTSRTKTTTYICSNLYFFIFYRRISHVFSCFVSSQKLDSHSVDVEPKKLKGKQELVMSKSFQQVDFWCKYLIGDLTILVLNF